MKIDKRRHYILMLDTETANTMTRPDGGLDMSNVLVYDCGFAVVDTHGKVYETHSYINTDIFCDERELMKSAYYAEKIPMYIADIKAGKRKMSNTYLIKEAIKQVIDKYGIKEVCAHNARFDKNALDVTQRYCSASKYRYFMPYGVEWWDTMKMAQDVICNMPTYKKYCQENNYLTAQGQPRKTAEILYRFITKSDDFVESHTGLEDVLIEKEIMVYCFRQHKPMRKTLYDKPLERAEPTPFQRELNKSLKAKPQIKRESF